MTGIARIITSVAVAVDTQGPTWSAGTPARVVDKPYFTGVQGQTLRQYDVSADGQRFLMLKEEPGDAGAAPSINVVQNWREELKRLVPAK